MDSPDKYRDNEFTTGNIGSRDGRSRLHDRFLRPPPLSREYYSDTEGLRRPRHKSRKQVLSPPRRAPLPTTARQAGSSSSYASIALNPSIFRRPSPPPQMRLRRLSSDAMPPLDMRPDPRHDAVPRPAPPASHVSGAWQDQRPRRVSGAGATDYSQEGSFIGESIPMVVGHPGTPIIIATEQDEPKTTPRRASSSQLNRATSPSPSTTDSGLFRSASDASRRSVSTLSGILGDKVYTYRSLGEGFFRLVRVLAQKSSQVKCEILHRRLDLPPKYLALSYAWGDAADTRKIQIRDETISQFIEMPISVSLYNALEALRDRDRDVLIWADQLSIDQQNRDERSQQISLMTEIYRRADSVALWLGSEEDNSYLAMELLQAVAAAKASPVHISSLVTSERNRRKFEALVALFERPYWKRLWVVQEILNAKHINVYCGASRLEWRFYKDAPEVFREYRTLLDEMFPRRTSHRRHIVSQDQFSHAQILVYQGPGSLPDLGPPENLEFDSLLEVMRVSRRKLSSEPKDKVFGVLGILPPKIRAEFTVDYGLSVKDIYTNIVDTLLHTTESLDVICEAIHFPLHTSTTNLPSWVPDWSHIPETSALALSPGTRFSASGGTTAEYKFLDQRRNKLEISAVPFGRVQTLGITVGTLCTLADYLMAFLHWRAILLGSLESGADDEDYSLSVQESFCETLCFRQFPDESWKTLPSSEWMAACYHVFGSLLRERLPHLALDKDLVYYAEAEIDLRETSRKFLDDNFSTRMMGRCFCLTDEGRMGMGTGFMASGDMVIVPLGCSTPILLRPEGTKGEYRFVGDVYINGYMHGKAVEQMKDGKRELKKYVLH